MILTSFNVFQETTTTAEPAPQVYIDVDYDDFEMDHRVSTG